MQKDSGNLSANALDFSGNNLAVAVSARVDIYKLTQPEGADDFDADD